jgi:hypothetical protein
MFADPKKRRVRRLKRQLKASASIVIALAAGAFLACQKDAGGPTGQNPGGPDARSGKDPERDAGTVVADAGIVVTDPSSNALDAGPASSAIVVHDDAQDAGKGVHVDKKEHRSGMPVRDNLLE